MKTVSKILMNQNQNIPNLFPDIRFAIYNTHLVHIFCEVRFTVANAFFHHCCSVFTTFPISILTWTYHYVHMFICKTEIYISYKINLNIHIYICKMQEQEEIDKKRLIEIVCLFLLSLSLCVFER